MQQHIDLPLVGLGKKFSFSCPKLVAKLPRCMINQEMSFVERKQMVLVIKSMDLQYRSQLTYLNPRMIRAAVA
jgi:hypothetical protein